MLIIALPKALLVQKKNIKLVFSEDYLAIMRENIGKNKGTTDIQFRIVYSDYVGIAWECQKNNPKFLLSYKEPNLENLDNILYNYPTNLFRFIITITIRYQK